MSVAGTSSTSSGTRHLPAVDGLRAIAIIVVVLNHAEVPGFGRGYIGVDMFFAISGFLITGRIVTSMSTGESQPLTDFWSGRARRILPALVVTIVATCLLSALVLGPSELGRVAGYGLAADLFVVNNLIAYKGGDYFAGPLRELPFLHLWSLAVEEQFYLIWPIALGPVARGLARVTGASYRRVISVVLALTTVGSLAASVILTRTFERWAFYGLPTRIYEFAIGAAAALFWTGRLGSRARQAAAGVGATALVLALVASPDEGIGFPSAWPVLAAGGTVLLILGTVDAAVPTEHPLPRWTGATLGSSPMRLIGRYSYSWYLWHWPAVVLGTIAWGAAWGRIASVASLALAVATFHLVEQPIRFLPSLVRSHRRSLAAGVVLLLAGAAATGALALYGRERLQDPYIADLTRAEKSFTVHGCEIDRQQLDIEVCLGGSDRQSDPLVLLVGDSHAGQWVAAFSEAGRQHNFRIALRATGNCSPYPYLPGSPARDRACNAFQAETEQLYDHPAVAAVIFGEAFTSRLRHGTPAEWHRAAADAVGKWSAPTGVIVDPPRYDDPLQCLARGGSDASCSIPRAEAFKNSRIYAPFEQRLADGANVSLLNLDDVVCPPGADPCPLKSGSTWIPAGSGHLTREFTLLQVDALNEFVATLLAQAATDEGER